jgi:hypothetical protein
MCAVLGVQPNSRATRHARAISLRAVDGGDVAHARIVEPRGADDTSPFGPLRAVEN